VEGYVRREDLLVPGVAAYIIGGGPLGSCVGAMAYSVVRSTLLMRMTSARRRRHLQYHAHMDRPVTMAIASPIPIQRPIEAADEDRATCGSAELVAKS
jgi:threonine dehydrogenase-like Zn-dependent dehydrogenase